MRARGRRTPHRILGERGSAMVVSLLVMAVLTGLGAVVFTTASSNLQNAGRDRRAGSAMGLAEAGIAEALAYMRVNGVGNLTCEKSSTAPPVYTGCDQEWGYNKPHVPTPSLSAGSQYSVWVQRVRKYTPGGSPSEGIYKITSTGTQQPGPGSRTVSVEIEVKPFDFPLGIYSDQYIREAGSVTVDSESVLTKGCIGKRENMTFTGTRDLGHPELVPAAHSTKWITTSNITGADDPQCKSTDSGNIHRPFPGPGICNPTYKFDRDAQGGAPLGPTPCSQAKFADDSSLFTLDKLRELGYSQARGLPASQYEFLKQSAQSQGNYYDCASATPIVPSGGQCTSGNVSKLVKPTQTSAIVYMKIDPTRTFNSSANAFSVYAFDPAGKPPTPCPNKSVVIVVEGGSLQVNSGDNLVGSIFVPDGNAHFNGGTQITGTVFAKSIFINGSGNVLRLDPCFFNNMPGGVQIVSPSNFMELDR